MTPWTHVVLEILNGVWAIAAASLLIICIFYFQHEARARSYRWQRGWRKMMTRGMKVSAAVGAISLGSTIRASTIFLWHLRGGHTDLQPGMITVGTIAAVTGFTCAVREFSEPIYGPLPWKMTLLTMVCFVVVDLATHLL